MQFPPTPNSGYLPVAQASADQQESQKSAPQQPKRSKGRPNNAPVCLILEPTKELAQQTHDEMGRFKKYLKNPEIR